MIIEQCPARGSQIGSLPPAEKSMPQRRINISVLFCPCVRHRCEKSNGSPQGRMSTVNGGVVRLGLTACSEYITISSPQPVVRSCKSSLN